MADAVQVVIARSYTTIRCPSCGGSRAETFTLMTPDVRQNKILGVTRGGELLAKCEAEMDDLPLATTIAPCWLHCGHCETHFPLPAGVYVRFGEVEECFHGDVVRFDQGRMTQEECARPIPIDRERKVA